MIKCYSDREEEQGTRKVEVAVDVVFKNHGGDCTGIPLVVNYRN